MSRTPSRPVAIITGARRGIGRAVALRLAADGFDVVVADLALPATADTLRAEIESAGAAVLFHALDISDVEAHAGLVSAALSAFGRVDCLVNNAGMGSVARGDLMGLTPENFDRVLDVNLRGTVFLTQSLLRAMLAGDGAHPRTVVNITSVSADLASPERIDYCISKAGLSMWTKGLALRLAPEGIAVFEVRPGIIRSDMTAGVSAKYDALIAGGLVPAGRWGEGADVADAVSVLASGRMNFSTGSIVHADGGLAIGRL